MSEALRERFGLHRRSSSLRVSQHTLNVYKEAFVVFDKKGTGTIAADALKKLLKSLGQDVKDEEVKAILELDTSSSDAISFDAFVKLMAARMDDTEQEEELLAVFEAIDQDKDGLISMNELKDTLESVLGEKLDDIQDLIGETKQNNKLDFTEFKKLMTGN
eukprot:TRINITY_DN1176_c0_g1_i3.p1 TRINITY_DN1176_c0_g1~~TRINITY_DN1176_c0_g1_i3.p1  ORF type:complete len:161 (+),score=37.26 TRINITY_DN1176_c0_g1_i3:113-595(+)